MIFVGEIWKALRLWAKKVSRCFKDEACRSMENNVEKNLNKVSQIVFSERKNNNNGLETILVIFCQGIWLLLALS